MEPPPEVPQQQQPPPPQAQSGPLSEEARMAAIQELYGPGKAYPEPYLAGKVPANLVHHRHKSRIDRTPFVYAVRFRSGPFGLSFDNRKTDCTVVERVLANMQAQLSDVQVGDYLIAVDQFNTTNANPKDVQRLTNSLPWPRILVFETKGNVVDPKMLEKHNQQRTLNVSVLYPPTLTGDFQMRVVDWTPLPSAMPLLPTPYSSQPTPDSCALYYLMSPQDPFGCEVKPLEFQLPEIVKNVIGQRGNVNSTVSVDMLFSYVYV